MNMKNIALCLLIFIVLGAAIGGYFYGLIGALAGGAAAAVVLICLVIYILSKADFG